MNSQKNIDVWPSFGPHMNQVGAVWPSSSARPLISEFARRAGARRVLKVGGGQEHIILEMVQQMGPDDELVLCELDEASRQRVENQPLVRAKQHQIRWIEISAIPDLKSEHFDVIISTLPFTTLALDVVETIFNCYQALLKPDGVLSFMQYADIRELTSWILTRNGKPEETNLAIKDLVNRYLFRLEVVWHYPPILIRHLRFHSPQAQAALTLAPLTHHRRISLGSKAGISIEAIPFLASLFGVALLLHRYPKALTSIGLLMAGVATFFRDPIRAVTPDPSVALAASDGHVLAVERLHDKRLGDHEWLRIAVFLSVADVHINRSPIAGKVRQIFTQQGGFAIASAKGAEDNYAEYTIIEGNKSDCVVAQRVGMVARRIVNWSPPGVLLAQGERFGLIRFGSRTDIYLPATLVSPCVTVGERVVGGVTIMARYDQ